VWTQTPHDAERSLALPDAQFLAALARALRRARRRLTARRERRTFPLALEYARHVVATRVAAIGNAAQALHPIAGRASTSACAMRGSSRNVLIDAKREAIGTRAMLERYARGRSVDRRVGVAFTNGLVNVFGGAALRLAARRRARHARRAAAAQARVHPRHAVRLALNLSDRHPRLHAMQCTSPARSRPSRRARAAPDFGQATVAPPGRDGQQPSRPRAGAGQPSDGQSRFERARTRCRHRRATR
jgi:2-polyprenyl-6-methoxyphenol hydroxylase-like FAD-dependent oxidoreductase